MAEFHVEAIFNTIRELKNERLHNEKQLAEEQAKRKEIESKLEDVMARYAIMQEKHMKMSEAVRVAEQKVTQAQCCIAKYEQLNQERRKRISELIEELKAEEAKRDSQLTDFEVQIRDLTEKFRNAKVIYTEHLLDDQITLYREQQMVLDAKVQEQEAQMQKLEAKLLQYEGIDTVETIPEDTWQTVVRLFTEENNAARKSLELSTGLLSKIQEKQQSLEIELQDFDQPCMQPIEE